MFVIFLHISSAPVNRAKGSHLYVYLCKMYTLIIVRFMCICDGFGEI